MKYLLLSTLLAALAAPAAAAGQGGPTPGPRSGEEARIPFVNFGGIRNFHADGTRGVFLQDRRRNWYYADLFGPCTDLPFAIGIGVKTWGMDTLDRSGTILVGRDQCRIANLVHSGPPPKKARRKRSS